MARNVAKALSIYLSVCMSVYLSVCMSVCLSVCPSVDLSLYLSLSLSISFSMHVFVSLAISPSLCISLSSSLLTLSLLCLLSPLLFHLSILSEVWLLNIGWPYPDYHAVALPDLFQWLGNLSESVASLVSGGLAILPMAMAMAVPLTRLGYFAGSVNQFPQSQWNIGKALSICKDLYDFGVFCICSTPRTEPGLMALVALVAIVAIVAMA